MRLIFRIFLLSTLLIGFASPAHPQKTAIIKQTGKFVAKKSVKESGERIARHELKEAGTNFAEKAIARRTIKSIAREKLLLSIKKEGYHSIMEYANRSASKRLVSSRASMFSRNTMKSTQPSYRARIVSIREAKNYISRTARRILIGKKDQYITSKDYLSYLAKNKPNLKLGYPKSGKTLEKNMLQCMPEKARKVVTDPKNRKQAHHIIGNATPKAQEKLQKFGIDINDPMNGIFLPADGQSGLKGTVHVGKHNHDYFDYIENLFSNCKSKQDCYDVLDKIKDGLYKGDIKLYNTHKVNNTFTNKIAA